MMFKQTIRLVCLAMVALVGTHLAHAYNPAIYAPTSKLATGKWVKITIPENGMYEITYEEYRRNGLAGTLAQRMCEEITSGGRSPVWSHAEANIGSGSTALKCGFKEERRVTTCQTDRN